MVHAATFPPLVWLHPRAGNGGAARPAAARDGMYYIIPAPHTDGSTARDLMRAAATADQPGATGMRGVAGADPNDREWTLVRVCVHEASHAVVAERYGHRTAIRIGRDEEFGTGLCMSTGLAHESDVVRRQVGLAGLLGHLLAERGAAFTLAGAIEAVRGGPMSESDLHLMDGTATPREIDICMRRLQLQWADVTTRASELLATELRYYSGRAQ